MEKEIYNDLCELDEIQSKIKNLKDAILDLYNSSDKNKCKNLLIEMEKAENDIKHLEDEYNKFLKNK